MAEGSFDPFFVYFNKISMTEHEGTHMDAPKHVLRDEHVAATAATVEMVMMMIMIIDEFNSSYLCKSV